VNCKKCGTEIYSFSNSCGNCGEIVNTTDIISDSLQSNEKETSKRMFISYPWRRFFARSMDTTIGGTFLYIYAYLPYFGYSELTANEITVGFLMLLMLLPLEASLISTFGTTPFKWVFGIRILNKNGKKLNYFRSFLRVIGVYIVGLGLGIKILMLITQLVAYKKLSKTGTTWWDDFSGSKVEHTEFGIARYTLCTLAVFGLIAFRYKPEWFLVF